MHMIYGAANCNWWKAVRMYRQQYSDKRVPCKSVFVILHRRLPPFIDNFPLPSTKQARWTCTSLLFVIDEQIGQLLQAKAPSKKWNVILLQVQALFPGTCYPSTCRLTHCTRRRTAHLWSATFPGIAYCFARWYSSENQRAIFFLLSRKWSFSLRMWLRSH